MAKCAVCGKDIGPEGPGGSEADRGRDRGFCGAKCEAEYSKNPERYGKKTDTACGRS